MDKLNLEAGLAAVDNADSLDSAQKNATKRILRAFAGEKEEETFSARKGDKFTHLPSKRIYMLTLVGRASDDSPGYCQGKPYALSLVDIKNGDRWDAPTGVCRYGHITHNEFIAICSERRSEFQRIEKPSC